MAVPMTAGQKNIRMTLWMNGATISVNSSAAEQKITATLYLISAERFSTGGTVLIAARVGVILAEGADAGASSCTSRCGAVIVRE
jgi:hypothetical protein